MSVNVLRFLDKFIGIPLCFLLTVYRKVTCLFKYHPSNDPQKFLFIKLSEMGSTVFLYPTISELYQLYPKAEIFFIVFKNNKDILDELNFTQDSNIYTVNTDSIFKIIVSGFHIVKTLRKKSIDTCFDMDFFSRLSSVLAFLICKGNRVGFHCFNNEGLFRGNLLTHRVMYSPHIHTSAAFFSLLKASLDKTANKDLYYKGFIDVSQFKLPDYMPSKMSLYAIKQKLKIQGLDVDNYKGQVVIVNPNASEIIPLRKWPLENFIHFCTSLLKKRSRLTIVLIGSSCEQKDAIHIQNCVNSKRCINLVGQTSIKELLALYTIADMMLSTDSGPAHFASLTKLPEIVLFGPETPQLFKPLGHECKCLYANFACSPCVSVFNAKKSPCRDNLCLKAISVERVLTESLNTLGIIEK